MTYNFSFETIAAKHFIQFLKLTTKLEYISVLECITLPCVVLSSYNVVCGVTPKLQEVVQLDYLKRRALPSKLEGGVQLILLSVISWILLSVCTLSVVCTILENLP